MEEKNIENFKEELLEAMNEGFSLVQEGFSQLEARLDKRFEGIDKRFEGIDARLNTMVTKDYLDDKLADLRGDLVVLTRQEDKKLCTLVDTLHHNKTLNTKETEKILVMEPFPDLGLSLKK